MFLYSLSFSDWVKEAIRNNNCFPYWCDTVIAEGAHWLAGKLQLYQAAEECGPVEDTEGHHELDELLN